VAQAPTDSTGPGRSTDGPDEIQAMPAGPGKVTLRAAYLDLLKLSLCDLAGAGTTSVKGLAHGRLVSWELDADELPARASGRDWPLHGLTMTGLARLNDLQRCVEAIVTDAVPGDLIEAGSWRGGSSLLMRATLDALGASEREVWVADSFQGFPAPEPEPGGYPGSLEPFFAAFDYLAAPLEQVRDSFARLGYREGVRFLPGFFEQTLPELAADQRRWSVIRLDCDTYDVTLLALRCLYPDLSRGGYVIIDDYNDIDECRQAVDDFRSEHSVEDPVERVDWSCARWRRSGDDSIARLQQPASTAAAPRRPVQRPQRHQIPTVRELELERELERRDVVLGELRAQLEQAGEWEQRFREVTTSTSWKLTRPARELAARLRARGR
jgi:O-methyltransferase